GMVDALRDVPTGSHLVELTIQGRPIQFWDVSNFPVPADQPMDTDDETPGDAAQGLYGVFPTRVLGRVSGDDTLTKGSSLPRALRHVPSKKKGGQKPTGTAPAAAASSGALAKSSSARKLPKKARGSIRESLATPGELTKTTGSTSRRSHAPKLRAAKCKAAASSGEGRTDVGPSSSPAADNKDDPDPETQRRIMNERCAALLEAQREAFRRRMEQRREAIKAATAKARAVHDPPVTEPMPAAATADGHAAISVDVGTHGEPMADVQPDATETSGQPPLPSAYMKCHAQDLLDFLMHILGRNLDIFALQHYVVVGVDVLSLFTEMLLSPRESRPNIVLIQESHWRFTSEYRHGNWLAYHNGVSAEQVRVHNVLQGRLTHVRIDFPSRLILLFWWMGDEPGIAPPTRAETSYFLSLFPRPSQMQKDQAEPMDTKDQPKRGIFEDTSGREESLSKAMKGEIHEEAASPKEPVGVRATALQPPVKIPVTGLPTPSSTTASPASIMTPQQQLLPNAATATPSGKGKTKKGKQGKGQGKGQKGNNDPSQTTSSSSHQDNVISAMGRLCLRHEDAIAVQRANQGYVWWLRTAGPESIVPSLARVSAAWNRKKDEEGIQEHPLRIVMLSTLLEVMIERAQAAVEPTRLEASAQAGLILNQGDEPFWPFLRWNPARRVEEIVSSEEARPLEHSRLMRKLNQVRDTINPENILRCHGYHSISENMTGDTWRLLLEIETVGEEAQNLHAWLRRMINCTAWKLIGGRFRRERLGRSPLANRLAELLG
ncbi:unnamed protein product, partial [Symbiodinium necroappetens]